MNSLKKEKLKILSMLTLLEGMLHDCASDDFGRYAKMGLRLEPDGPDQLHRYGGYLESKTKRERGHASNWDWSYLEYMRKAVENETDPDQKIGLLHSLRHCEATREIYTSSIKQLNSLIQFDPEPNQMTEAKVELYKVTISFQPGGNKISMQCFM